MTKPRIVISIETLLSGGAESFAVRLANHVCSQFEVSLIVVKGNLFDKSVAKKLDRSVHLVRIDFPLEWFIRKFDGALLRLGIDYSLRDHLVATYIRKFLKGNQIGLIHSNQFKVDYIFLRANERLHIPHLITVHGDYLNFSERSKQNTLRIIQFEQKAKRVLQSVDKIVYISDHQLEFIISDLGLSAIARNTIKLYNGVETEVAGSEPVTSARFKRKEFVFGMVARGIREKGWEESIKAFKKIYVPGVQLVLVGKSDYLDELKKVYRHEDIYFAGYSEYPVEWVGLFDVGLLPSTFASESLPTSVIEYIMMGKPVVASDKGEIRKMLEDGNDKCGIVVEIKDNRIDEQELATAMEMLWRNKELYNKMASQTKKFAAYFDMKNCGEAYMAVYHSLMKSRS